MRSLIDYALVLSKKGLQNKINEVNQSDFYTSDRILDYQNFKLNKLITHSYHNIPYYRNIFNELGLTPSDIKTTE